MRVYVFQMYSGAILNFLKPVQATLSKMKELPGIPTTSPGVVPIDQSINISFPKPSLMFRCDREVPRENSCTIEFVSHDLHHYACSATHNMGISITIPLI